MRVGLLTIVAATVLGAAALPAMGLGGTASEHLSGVVTPTIGAAVDAQGRFVRAGGTQPATVTREDRGSTVLITITPAF